MNIFVDICLSTVCFVPIREPTPPKIGTKELSKSKFYFLPPTNGMGEFCFAKKKKKLISNQMKEGVFVRYAIMFISLIFLQTMQGRGELKYSIIFFVTVLGLTFYF